MTATTSASNSLWPSNSARANVRKIVDDAVEQFLAARFADGATVPKTWLTDALQVPRQAAGMRWEDGQRLQTEFLSRFEDFRLVLLTTHKIAMQSDYTGGYRIIPPGEQARWAQASLNNDLSSSFRKAGQRAANVRVESLSDAERNERLLVLAGITAVEAAVSSERAKLRRRKIVDGG